MVVIKIDNMQWERQIRKRFLYWFWQDFIFVSSKCSIFTLTGPLWDTLCFGKHLVQRSHSKPGNILAFVDISIVVIIKKSGFLLAAGLMHLTVILCFVTRRYWEEFIVRQNGKSIYMILTLHGGYVISWVAFECRGKWQDIMKPPFERQLCWPS